MQDMEAVGTEIDRNRKRKQHEDDSGLQLRLSLSSTGPHQSPPSFPNDGWSTPTTTSAAASVSTFAGASSRNDHVSPRSTRPRRGTARATPHDASKPDFIPPPFDWATDRRAKVHTFDHLISVGITTIRGEVQCRRCEYKYPMEHDLRSKFLEIRTFIVAHMERMRDRAPKEWMNPKLPDCRACHHPNCLKPVIPPKKRSINWLFLFLGQMMGCCTLDQLKYFCKHTGNHRTGAKDRVLYLAYLDMCKQLDPAVPFLH